MSIVTTANVTRVTSTDVTIQWGASTPIKWVGYKFSGDADYTELYNDLTNVGKLSDYFVINQLTASTSYTVTVKMISVTGTVETTDYPVVSFTTPAAGSLAASLKAKLIGNDTVLVIWETNIGLTGLSYTINSGAAVQVPVTAGLTSNSFYIEDIENDDVLVVQFINSTLVQTLSLTIIISSEDSIGLDEDRTLPAIPVDMSDLLFPYIYFDPLERPRGIITALEWNTLARLLIHQGNYTAKALNQLDLSILQTDPYAVMIKATQIDPGDLSANNVQAKLEKLQSEHDALKAGGLSDSSVATSKIIDSAVTTAKINNSAVTTDKINDSAITTVKINDSAITTAKVNDGAVTSNKLDTNAKKAENLSATAMSVTDTSEATIQAKLNHLQEQVTATSQGGVADNSISTAKIIDSAITTGKINNSAVTTPKIADSAVTTPKIADSAVTTPKIADSAITLVKTDATFRLSLVPSGLISMWSGANVPNGWYLCDGTNGTPDLRDRFIVGAGASYNIGDTGGSDTVTLTIEQMPQHRHSYTYLQAGINGAEVGAGRVYVSGTQSGSTGFTGEGQAHENRPPYYALAYIMKA